MIRIFHTCLMEHGRWISKQILTHQIRLHSTTFHPNFYLAHHSKYYLHHYDLLPIYSPPPSSYQNYNIFSNRLNRVLKNAPRCFVSLTLTRTNMMINKNAASRPRIRKYWNQNRIKSWHQKVTRRLRCLHYVLTQHLLWKCF